MRRGVEERRSHVARDRHLDRPAATNPAPRPRRALRRSSRCRPTPTMHAAGNPPAARPRSARPCRGCSRAADRSGPTTSASPLARAISTTAIAARQHPPLGVDRIAERTRHRGRRGAIRRRAASSVSSVPSPPSASGSSTTSSKPARRRPAAIAAAASSARNVPRNLSGHATARSVDSGDTSHRLTGYPAVVASGSSIARTRPPSRQASRTITTSAVEPGHDRAHPSVGGAPAGRARAARERDRVRRRRRRAARDPRARSSATSASRPTGR